MLCYRLSEGLHGRGHDVSVLTLADREHECAPDPGEYRIGCRMIRTLKRVDRRNLIRGTWHNHRETVEILQSASPDVVLFFSTLETGYQVYHDVLASGVPCLTVMGDTWLAQAWADLPRYDEYIGFASGRGKGLHIWAKRLAGWGLAGLGLFNGKKPLFLTPVAAISSFLVDSLLMTGLDKLTVKSRCRVFPVPLCEPYMNVNGVPAGIERMPHKEGPLKAICVSRLDPQKGQDDAIRAVAIARAMGADVTLTIAGMDRYGYRQTLEQLVSAEGLETYVTIMTDLPEHQIKKLYLAHDVFLFPSRILEGLGIACAEAMACGLPIIATTPGGQDDLVVPGETGFRFNPGDVKRLAALLCGCIRNRVQLGDMGQRAMQTSRRHAAGEVLDSVQSLVNSLRGHSRVVDNLEPGHV